MSGKLVLVLIALQVRVLGWHTQTRGKFGWAYGCFRIASVAIKLNRPLVSIECMRSVPNFAVVELFVSAEHTTITNGVSLP